MARMRISSPPCDGRNETVQDGAADLHEHKTNKERYVDATGEHTVFLMRAN
jgi:hypothetical protein